MLNLHHAPRLRSMRILWRLAVGEPFEVHDVSIARGQEEGEAQMAAWGEPGAKQRRLSQTLSARPAFQRALARDDA